MERLGLDDGGSATYKILGTVFILIIGLVTSYVLQNGGQFDIPLAGQELGNYNKRLKVFIDSSSQLFDEGYEKFKQSIWRITTADGEMIMIAQKYLDELRKFPDHVIDLHEVTKEGVDQLQGKHTHGLENHALLFQLVKKDLTQNLAHVNAALTEEVMQTVDEKLGPCEDWTAININQALLQIVAIASGRIFLGADQCRRPEYLRASITFAINLMQAAGELKKKWPKFLRGISKFFVPEIAKLDEERRRAREFLLPIICECKRLLWEHQAGRPVHVPDDMLQWMVNKRDEFNIKSDEELADTQLQLSMAAIHTTTITATNVFYDIVGECPEVIPALRAEIRTVLQQHDGVMTTQALFHMKLLDSVMRESQRLNPPGFITSLRKVMKPVTFSDGTRLPAGATIGIPLRGALRDPANYPDPLVFKPGRFLALRSGEAEEAVGYGNREQYQFVSVTKDNCSFGWGRHACPGRFFASNEIKLILATILLKYDMKMPDEAGWGRYPNIVSIARAVPDPTKSIMFRRAAAV